jgi:transcription termination factor Rho
MSVGSDALTRSKLEQKDRAELAAIVEAMGGRATSRTRKAELVDLVLQLAAHDEQPGAADAASDSESAVPAPPNPGPSVAEDHDGPATEPEPAEVAAPVVPFKPRLVPAQLNLDAEPKAEWELDLEAGGVDVADEPVPGDRAPEPPRDRDRGRPEGAGGPGSPSRPPQGVAGQGSGGGPGPQPQPQPPAGEQNRDDGEGGSRRRRRRGRDRDRPEGPAAPGNPAPPRPDQQQPAPRERQPERQPEQPEPAFAGDPVEAAGHLDLRDEGYGFLRLRGFLPSKDDVYVSVKQVRQFGLRRGDFVKGASRPASRNEKNPALLRIDSVNDRDPEAARTRRRFEDLTPLFPDTKLPMELPEDPSNMTARIIDLISPIGKGQRGLIVSPPKAGKTTIMKQIARSIEVNSPETRLIVLLVDERPEEVTDMRRWLQRGEVAASTFDRPAEEHTQVAELTLERAKRMVESGDDVVILLDGLTRLARAYNQTVAASGRVISGGVDSGALYPPKRFFGAARNVEEGGSLTILATALVETGSRMDEVIFEEFEGTGNMELRLDRRMADRRIYPAIDVNASSTRHEELLFDGDDLDTVWKLRRVISGLAAGEGGSAAAGLELLLDRMKTFPTNRDFLSEVAKAPSVTG